MTWQVGVEFRPSRLHGMGAFAREPIAAGTRVWTFDDAMHVSDLPDLAALRPDRLRFALHGGYYHAPAGRFVWYEDGMQFVNHAEPGIANIGIREWTALEDDHCAALRDIRPGEELLEDYGFWSVVNLPASHWLHTLYRDFCPEHYRFLLSLRERRVAA